MMMQDANMPFCYSKFWRARVRIFAKITHNFERDLKKWFASPGLLFFTSHSVTSASEAEPYLTRQVGHCAY
jgi:hypothetical protein